MIEKEPNWTELIKDTGPDLYRFFLGSFSGPLASELVQESLIRLVLKFRNGDFDSSKGTLKNFESNFSE